MSKKKQYADGSPVPPGESFGDTSAQANGQKAPPLTRRQRWVRHINRRWQNFAKAARYLGNMAKAASYEYTEAERDQLLKAIKDKVREIEDCFLAPLNKARTEAPLFDYAWGDWAAPAQEQARAN